MIVKPIRPEAHRLMLDGALTLADAEEAGVAIDVPYLKRQQEQLAVEIKRLKNMIESTEEAKLGRRRYGRQFDPSNNNHVAYVLQAAGHALPQTENENTNNVKTDGETLQDVGGEFVEHVMRVRKLEKVSSTYITGWLREVGPDGYMHPTQNLHTVKTFRPSTNDPNMANVPRRDAESLKILRTGVIPSNGNQLLEVDYGAQEVRGISFYTRDEALINYIVSGSDIHSDVASWDLGLPRNEITKVLRDMGKNGAVFPRFYGSWWKSIAANYWKRILAEDPKTVSGKRLKDHVKNLANLQRLVEVGEDTFWGKFQQSRDWQDRWVEQYKERGWFEMLTGHRCSGIMSRNLLYNAPVQGTAFICLLWSLVEINRRMKREKMESRIILQIYDSILFDMVPGERSTLLPLVREVMEDEIRRHWGWICVPLLAEFEETEVDGNWAEKKKAVL